MVVVMSLKNSIEFTLKNRFSFIKIKQKLVASRTFDDDTMKTKGECLS